METLQLYILIVNVFVMLVMLAFLTKNRDLKGRLFFAEQLQDKMRERVKYLETEWALLHDAKINHEGKIASLEMKVSRIKKNGLIDPERTQPIRRRHV